jgi:hypothetical protein
MSGVVFPSLEVLGVTDPEGTRAVGLVQPLIQASVQELAVFHRVRFVFGVRVAVEADVGMDIAIVGFVLDFAVKLHCDCSFMVNGVENVVSNAVIARSQMSDSSFQEAWTIFADVRSNFCH